MDYQREIDKAYGQMDLLASQPASKRNSCMQKSLAARAAKFIAWRDKTKANYNVNEVAERIWLSFAL